LLSYVAYGLGIHSAFPLPELVSQERTADIVVQLGKVDCSRLEAVTNHHAFWAEKDEACYFFCYAGAFLVRSGCEILVDPVPGAEEGAIRLALLGPALALALLQRGRCILHASAVSIAGRTTAFLGGNGWGKSTIAAALHACGHDMVTDDVMAIDMDTDCPLVIPSFPQFKLWPDASTALGQTPETLPFLLSGIDKRARRIEEGFAQVPLPLECIYVLARGEALEVTPLQPQEALQELIRHSYGTRFGPRFFNVIDMQAHFSQCARLSNTLRFYRLKRPPCLTVLPELAKLITETSTCRVSVLPPHT
jgi:hypothetical protein